MIERIKNHILNGIDILEPSCGSCEIISYIDKEFDNISITGIEHNDDIFEKIKNITFSNNVSILKDVFLKHSYSKKYDIIVGNPPYFVMSKKDYPSDYNLFFSGRPNIFILFIIHSLKLLKEDGVISFILPRSFLNCLYYDKTRKYIYENFTIIDIVETCAEYIDTRQKTIIFIFQNKKNNIEINSSFVLEISGFTVFSTKKNIIDMKKLLENSKTLENLGFYTKIGNVVWNQSKNILTDNSDKTLLIYSSDISNNKLDIKKYKNADKKII